jgi:imidazolonepropionase
MAVSLACQEDRVTPAEALRAATLGGAAALGLQHEVGSLDVGRFCDLLVLDTSTHQELPYHWGVNLVSGVLVGGQVVVRDRQVVRPPVAPSAAAGGPA